MKVSPLTQHGHKAPISRAADPGHCCILGNESEVTAGSEVALHCSSFYTCSKVNLTAPAVSSWTRAASAACSLTSPTFRSPAGGASSSAVMSQLCSRRPCS